MRDFAQIAFIALALGLSFVVGAHAGRAGERRSLQSGKVDRSGTSPVVNWEIELRKARGARLQHPNPESATRIKKAHIKR